MFEVPIISVMFINILRQNKNKKKYLLKYEVDN